MFNIFLKYSKIRKEVYIYNGIGVIIQISYMYIYIHYLRVQKRNYERLVFFPGVPDTIF